MGYGKPSHVIEQRSFRSRYASTVTSPCGGPASPADPPQGEVTVDAYLDLNERCSMTWEGLPYPISDLTGRLELHPDHWVFKNMRGRNGLATIKGEGEVKKVGASGLKTDLH